MTAVVARILAVGVVTLDVINRVAAFPTEDAKVRALAQVRERGGNAANTLAVLAQLGHHCELATVFADDADGLFVRDALIRAGVGHGHGIFLPGSTPTSYVTLNTHNASRTIVHWRDLPEYPAARFARIPLGEFDWLHCEGRAPAELDQILAYARTRPGLRISLEVEKPRPGLEALFPRVDLLLFSRQYVHARGHAEPQAFLADCVPSGVEACCTWGAAGAWVYSAEGTLHASPAFVPDQVRDTLGAGDVFNAGYIHARLAGVAPPEALTQACRLAGAKCGVYGFAGLAVGGA